MILLLSLMFFMRCDNTARRGQELTAGELNAPGEIRNVSTNHIFSFISPGCEHCVYQAKAVISDHENKPKDLNLTFLANVHPDTLKVFASQFEYDTASTVFVVDENGELAQQMGVTSYPTMFLYDTAGVHLQTIVGEAKPAYVYKFFHEPH